MLTCWPKNGALLLIRIPRMKLLAMVKPKQNEAFGFPDVVVCPSAGDGCDDSNSTLCLPMDWYISTLSKVSTRRG